MSINRTSLAETAPFTPPPDAPRWFVDNLRQAGESHYVDVSEGPPAARGRVHFLAWNWHDSSRPTLLFLHGFSGHAHWWSYLMPFFTDRYRVAALDLPGMGDSSHLTSYDDACFAHAVISLLRQHNIEQTTVIGHSFGGAQAARAMALAPELFNHGIIVDTVVRFDNEAPPSQIDIRKQHRVRATRSECVEAFRLMPPQPEVLQPLVDFVAFHSCTPTTGGWQWKFDPAIRTYGDTIDTTPHARVTTRVDCVYGEQSMFSTDNIPQRVLESFPNHGQLIMVPGAHHHLMLDRPLELVAVLNRLLSAPAT